MTWPRPFTCSAAPGAPTPVEPQPAVEDAPARASSAATLRADPFAADRHRGSADLEEFPPSVAEGHFAWRVIRDPTDQQAARDLRHLAKSEMRAAAVLRHVRKCADADRIARRIDGRPL